METWWIGETVSMPRALAFIGLAYLLNLAFVSVTGFRGRKAGSRHPLTEALEATGMAVIAAVVLLTLLHQILPGMPLDVLVGRIAVDMLPISLGVSVAHQILAPNDSRTGENESAAGDDAGEDQKHLPPLVMDVGAAFAGALFLALSIAPTEEVPMLATEVPVAYLPVVVIFSLVVTYAIVFEAGFGGRDQRRQTSGLFQRPATETVLAYVTSLLVCAIILWLYGQIDFGDEWFTAYSQIIILGLPASIGAAAGRLAV